MQPYPKRGNVRELIEYEIRLLGANGAYPTKELGDGVTVTRTGEGAYRVTFAEDPFEWVGYSHGFQAATPADLAGYTVVCDTYTVHSKVLDFVVYNSSFAAADIIAAQYISLTLKFARTGL